jgi:CBS domain-containing protein
MKLAEICSGDVVFIRPEESAAEAARLMRERHVGGLVVAEERGDARYPIGIITDRDLTIEIMARSVDPESVTAADMIGTQQLTTANGAEDLFAALERMRIHGVRRMPVIDDAGALLGIITMDDILKLLAEQITDLVRLVSREYQHETRLRRA